jgi:prepilin-type N-terminal cleavage/methylation domain-containing protein
MRTVKARHRSKKTRWPRITLPGVDHRGFTLVEMMIALLVFGIGLVALAQTMPQGLSMRDRARRMSVATNLAQQEVERLRSVPYDDPLLSAGTHTDPMGPIDGAFTRSWVVVDDSPVENMKTVTVTVSFPTSSPDSMAILTTRLWK